MTNVISLNVPTKSQPQDRSLLKQLKEEEGEEGEAQQEESGPHLLDTPHDDGSLILNDDLVFFVARKDSSNNNDENSNLGSSMNNEEAVMNEKIPNGFLLSHNQKTTHVRGYTTSTPLRRRMHQSNGSGCGFVPERGWKSTPRRTMTTTTKAPSRLPLTIRSPPRFNYSAQNHSSYDPNYRRSLRLPTPPMILNNEPPKPGANVETTSTTPNEDRTVKENHHHSRRQVVNKATLIESTISRRNGLSKQRVNSCPKLHTTSTQNNKAPKRQRYSFHDDMDLNSKSSELPALFNNEIVKLDARQKNDLLETKPIESDNNGKTLPNIDSAIAEDGVDCEINNHIDKQETNKDDESSSLKKSKDKTEEDDSSIVLDMINTQTTARKVIRPDMMSLSLVLCIEPNMANAQQDRTSPISVDTMEDEEDVLAGVALNTPVSNCETSGVMHLSSTTSTSGSSYNNVCNNNRFSRISRSSSPDEMIDGMIVIKNVDSIIITPPEGNEDDVNEDLLIELFRKMSLSGSNVDNDDEDYDDENDEESRSTSISVSCSGSTGSSSTSICEADDEGTDGDDDDVDEYPLGDTPPSMKLTASSTTYSPCSSGDDDDHASSFTSSSSHFDSDLDVHNQRSPLSMEGVKINLKMFLPGIDNNDECDRCETQDNKRNDLQLVHNDDQQQELNSTTVALTPTTTPKSFSSEAQGSQFSYAETVVASNVKRSRSPIRLTKSTRTIRKKGLRKTDKVDVGCSCIIL